MIDTITTVLIMNCGLYTLMNFINPGYLGCAYNRWKTRRNPTKWAMTQEQGNISWENPIFNIDTISANMVNVLQITAFFGPLLPLGFVYSFFFFVFNYWIYKV